MYEIPKALIEVMGESVALLDLRDKLIKRRVRLKKLISLSFMAQSKRNEFWYAVFELYPELKGTPLNCDMGSRTVSEKATP